MKKTGWKYLIDVLMFFCMTGMIFIGILLGFVLAEGPRVREADKYFLNLHRHQWGHIHLYLSLTFVGLLVIHILLNWSWIKGKSKDIFRRGWKAALTIIAVLAVAVIFLFWAFTPKHAVTYEQYGLREGERAGQGAVGRNAEFHDDSIIITGTGESFAITGRNTLEEAAKAVDVPVSEILAAMKLPPGVPSDETLGRLRRQYGFSLLDFRDVLNELAKRQPAETDIKAPEETSYEEAGEKETRPHEEQRPYEEHKEGEKAIRGRMAEDQSGILITGQMTIREIAEKSGVSAADILKAMNLPGGTPLDETLGRLRRRYGFSIPRFREVVESLMKKEAH